MEVSPIIKEKAPLILAEIQKAKSVLLHCHPSPDPDSVGSTLAMKAALEQMGKKATVIKGDSEIPDGFMHFPGADQIVQNNFFEMDLKDFDLFIILDTGSPTQISRVRPIDLPFPIRSVIIDHHASNAGFADINLIEASSPAVCQILFELFGIWGVKITPEIASNLFIGIYTDTGGFKYSLTTQRSFAIAADLLQYIPDFPKLISDMENSNTLADLSFKALALESVEVFGGGKIGLAVVSNEALKAKNIPLDKINTASVTYELRTVSAWAVSGILTEIEPGKIKMNFRSKDGDRYDVSKLAVAMNGGGHKAASGATMSGTLEEIKTKVVAKAKELYNL
ncbi:MAG: bifunctional oligoribonuclease/PAP phosphatase NrnA [Candidatus Paceibacterota bacterium]